MVAPRLQIAGRLSVIGTGIERWLDAERDQLVLWLPVMLGTGIALWFALPSSAEWAMGLCGLTGTGLLALAVGRSGRALRALGIGALVAALGLAIIWTRAEYKAAPVLGRPTIARFDAVVERIEPLPPRGLVRLRLRPVAVLPSLEPGRLPDVAVLPPHIRVNLTTQDVPAGLADGATIRLGARLMPPPPPALPGAYDYARVAWFDGIGATGRGYRPIEVIGRGTGGKSGLRARLSANILAHVPGAPGGIAAALATGDQGAILLDDAEAMRRAGLAHLLSVSGLHLSAVVAATMFLVLRLLALSPWLALRWPLPMIAAGAGAVAAIGYTLLTGAEVPTVRSCVAALMVLAALALGREAITLRLVATGAIVVLLVVPEALPGPSFQLSFAAVASIVALHEWPPVRRWLAARDEARVKGWLRNIASLLLTGLVVEAALAPIAIYHFHREGLYGSFANIIAIPLTTFVIMPAEALALLADMLGLGAPFWWITRLAITALLWVAHVTANAPGAVASLPSMPTGAFALMICGGMWLGLWRTRGRLFGIAPVFAGALWAAMTPPPDLLITGDGRHLAVRTAQGGIAMLRDRAGDYTQAMLAEIGGVDDMPELMSDRGDAICSRDLCVTDIARGSRHWRILATRSTYPVPIEQLKVACGAADIVVSERRLPRSCIPRWLKLDRPTLARTGGISIALPSGRIETVLHPGDAHPWRAPQIIPVSRSGGGARRADPARAPAAGGSVGDHKSGWPDQA
jgi:competence protein ComEC